MSRACSIAAWAGLACVAAQAQEAGSGISIPATISGEARYGNLQNGYADASASAGFRLVVTPTLRLGSHWFAYSAFDVRSSSYYGYESGPDTDRPVRMSLMQAFLGYNRNIGKASILVKAGRLNSAFGWFATQYDDAKTPFPNPPPSYLTTLPLRPDQLPCGVKDLLWQEPGEEIDFECGGSQSEAYGMVPATIYGLLGAEVDLSVARFDARLQVTNSSPVNPQGLTSSSQFAQWTSGGGYTFGSGLHVGVSGFRGPYLDHVLQTLLPSGGLRSLPAVGFGTDVQWARGRWSMDGEWQRFRFSLPGFQSSPSEQIAYGELKAILTPRMFVAVRASELDPGRVEDSLAVIADHGAPPQQVYEFGFGFRPNNHQLIKLAYERVNRASDWQQHGNGLELQLVTSVTAFARAFR